MGNTSTETSIAKNQAVCIIDSRDKVDKQEKSGLGKQSKSFLNCIFRGTAMYV